MTIKKLVKEICRREGLKKQVDIAQVSEIIGNLSDIAYKDYTRAVSTNTIHKFYSCLVLNGEKRFKSKKK